VPVQPDGDVSPQVPRPGDRHHGVAGRQLDGTAGPQGGRYWLAGMASWSDRLVLIIAYMQTNTYVECILDYIIIECKLYKKLKC